MEKKNRNTKFKAVMLVLTLLGIMLIGMYYFPGKGIVGLYNQLIEGILSLLMGIFLLIVTVVFFKTMIDSIKNTRHKINTNKDYIIGLLILIRTIILLCILFFAIIFVFVALFNEFSLTTGSIVLKILGILVGFLIVKLVPMYKNYCKNHPSKQREVCGIIFVTVCIPVILLGAMAIGLYVGETKIYNSSLDLAYKDIKQVEIHDISVQETRHTRSRTNYYIVGKDENNNRIVFPIHRDLYKEISKLGTNNKRHIVLKYYPRTKVIETYNILEK